MYSRGTIPHWLQGVYLIQIFLSGAPDPLLSNIPRTTDSFPNRCWHGSSSGDERIQQLALSDRRALQRALVPSQKCTGTRYIVSHIIPTVAALNHLESGQKWEGRRGKTVDSPYQSAHVYGFDNGHAVCLNISDALSISVDIDPFTYNSSLRTNKRLTRQLIISLMNLWILSITCLLDASIKIYYLLYTNMPIYRYRMSLIGQNMTHRFHY